MKAASTFHYQPSHTPTQLGRGRVVLRFWLVGMMTFGVTAGGYGERRQPDNSTPDPDVRSTVGQRAYPHAPFLTRIAD